MPLVFVLMPKADEHFKRIVQEPCLVETDDLEREKLGIEAACNLW